MYEISMTTIKVQTRTFNLILDHHFAVHSNK